MKKILLFVFLLAIYNVAMPLTADATFVLSTHSGWWSDGYHSDWGGDCGTPESPTPCENDTYSFLAIIPQDTIKEYDDGYYHVTETKHYDHDSKTMTYTKDYDHYWDSDKDHHSVETYDKDSCSGAQCTPWEMKTIGEAQLFVQITDIGDTIGGDGIHEVQFSFQNIGPEESSITDIYFFDDHVPELLDYDNMYIMNNADVAFSENASPPQLPGYSDDPVVSADADPPPAHEGINEGEYLEIIFSLANGSSFNDLKAALEAELFVTGLHVQAFGCGEGSMSFINNICGPSGGPQVPEPTTMLLLGTGLVGIAGTARKRRKNT